MIHEHKNKVRFINLLLILVAVPIGMLGIDFSMNYLWKNWYWDYAPLHFALEILGSVAAILMSIVLLQMKQEKKVRTFSL